MALLQPDRYFSRISRIDIQHDLLEAGLDSVLLDIDNTILSRATHDIPHDVGVWMGKARDAGVRFCLVSNNWHGTVHRLAERLELPIVAKSVKPLPFAFYAGMRKLGATTKDSVCIGDQLFTDVLGAHLVGIPAYMVMPLSEVDVKQTVMIRNLERMLLRDRMPEPATFGNEPALSKEANSPS